MREVTWSDDPDDDCVYPTVDEAVGAALADGGDVIVHMPTCRYGELRPDSTEREPCTCEPTIITNHPQAGES